MFGFPLLLQFLTHKKLPLQIVDLEVLSSKALVLPIYTEESNILLHKLSSAKVQFLY